MFVRKSLVLAACCAVAVLTAPVALDSQSYRLRGVSPIFDGWEDLPDGTRLLHFGYINRNPSEVVIPTGGDNAFAPGAVDRGQPTSFLQGRHEHVFAVKVPKDMTGKLVWSLKSEMGVQTANASFEQLHILAQRENDDPNAKAPTIKIADLTATVGKPLPLNVHVTPAVNSGRAEVEGASADAAGLHLAWSKYRGTGQVTFSAAPSSAHAAVAEPPPSRARAQAVRPGVHNVACGIKPVPSCAAAVAVFDTPGVYTLRIAARQEGLQELAFVKVTVNP